MVPDPVLQSSQMLQDLALALRLQTLDRKIASLETEIAAFPRHIAEIERQLESHTRRLEHDRAALKANATDRKKLEGEVQVHEAKISKLRDQMLQAKTNEQYRAFQNEIAYAEGEIRKAEDRILELMESSEAVETKVKASEADLKKQSAHVENEKNKARATTAIDQKQLDESNAERKQVAGQMDPNLQSYYERIRKKTRNTPIVEATDGRCDGCRIGLRPQFFQDLRKGDKVMMCESCGRILVYNPVVEFSEV
jgi:predicted  nucleic acid-binding Zn-ribbon protein